MYAQPHGQPRPRRPYHQRFNATRRINLSGPQVWIAGLGATVIVAFLLGLLGLGLYLYATEDAIPSGVTVAGLPVGGESLEAAQASLQANLPFQQITLRDGDRSWQVALSDLGIGVDMETTLRRVENASSGEAVVPHYTVDLNQAQTGLIFMSDLVNIPAQAGDAPRAGRAIDIPVVLERLRVDVSGEIADGMLELSMIQVAPPEPEPVARPTGETTVHVVERGQELGLIAQMYGVSVNDVIALNDLDDPNLLYVGQELIIPAAGMYTPTAAKAPAAPTSSGKSIVVSTGDQRIYAYENGQLVRSHLVSTGLPDTPTVLGDYKVYVKYVATDMSGPDYFLPQVPYTMYFYQGYGIHGTYWHNSFGRPMSHGCVNLPTPEAEWFFNWAEVGTPVRVI